VYISVHLECTPRRQSSGMHMLQLREPLRPCAVQRVMARVFSFLIPACGDANAATLPVPLSGGILGPWLPSASES